MSPTDPEARSSRVALVTGSARGIGRAIAEALAAAGHAVIGADVLDPGPGAPGRTLRVDLGDPDACRPLVAEVGRVDVLVNNAAVLIEAPLEGFRLDDFDRTIAVNLRAPFLLPRRWRPRWAGGAGAGSSTSRALAPGPAAWRRPPSTRRPRRPSCR